MKQLFAFFLLFVSMIALNANAISLQTPNNSYTTGYRNLFNISKRISLNMSYGFNTHYSTNRIDTYGSIAIPEFGLVFENVLLDSEIINETQYSFVAGPSIAYVYGNKWGFIVIQADITTGTPISKMSNNDSLPTYQSIMKLTFIQKF
ncbi:MAG: hypothetical protein LBJ18_00375 [Rickettsiales bacterium]|jgi:hypothetical protein|nr:hypothetical protein [Rickettsiales bacterium]